MNVSSDSDSEGTQTDTDANSSHDGTGETPTSTDSRGSQTPKKRNKDSITHHRIKPMVEDRALQAVLAERRRSLEYAKTGVESHRHRRRGPARNDVASSISKGRHRMASMRLHRELKRRQMGHLGHPGMEEIYTDKDRAAAVTMGDQDIKTSLKVKQMNERRVLLPEDMDSNIYLTEAQKNITVGHLEIALICANKAVENAQFDPQSLLVRSRCYLLLGKLQEALRDAQQAMQKEPNLIKGLLVQAEALYAMGEFERGLVLFHRGYKKRKDIVAFKRGIQKSKEAILNAIGSKNFPQAPNSSMKISDQLDATKEGDLDALDCALMRKKTEPANALLSSTKRNKPKDDCPKPIVPSIKTTKLASKKLLGGLSSDKEFLSKLLERKDIHDDVVSSLCPKPRIDRRRNSAYPTRSKEVHTNSESDVAHVAKEALQSLQHLEAFLWQRDPSELAADGQNPHGDLRSRKSKKGLKKSRDSSSYGAVRPSKRRLDIKSNDKFQQKVSTVIEKLHGCSDHVLKKYLEQAEDLLAEMRQTSSHCDHLQSICSLEIAVGWALQRDGRVEDSLAVFNDALQIAETRNFGEENRRVVEWMGRTLRATGRDAEAIDLWSIQLNNTQNPHTRSMLFSLLAKYHFDVGHISEGIGLARESFSASQSVKDESSCLAALLMIATAQARVNSIAEAKETLEEASAFISSDEHSNKDILEDYAVLKKIIQSKSSTIDDATIEKK